jgi:hypothetical protein
MWPWLFIQVRSSCFVQEVGKHLWMNYFNLACLRDEDRGGRCAS